MKPYDIASEKASIVMKLVLVIILDSVNMLVSKYYKICKHTSYGEHKWFIKCIFDVDFNPHQGFIKVIKSLKVQHKWIDLYPGFV